MYGNEENAKKDMWETVLSWKVKVSYKLKSEISYSTEVHICDFNPIFMEYSRVCTGHLKFSVTVYCLIGKKLHVSVDSYSSCFVVFF